MLIKDPEIEQAIPLQWRNTIHCINNAIVNRNLEDIIGRTGIIKANIETISLIYNYITEYGFQLCSLSDATWNTSKCRWMINHWHVMVDLSTVEEGLSDLVLFISVSEIKEEWVFSLESVHVA